MVKRGEVLWASLPAAAQEEMDEVVAMLTEAAAQGHMMAQAYLADIYAFGQAVAQDYGRAFELYRQAARQGHALSQTNLGVSYRDGLGVPQSYERAFELFKLSAAQGNALATTNLGASYYNGRGVDQSYAEARRLFELAVARGEAYAASVNLQRLNDFIQQRCPLLGQRVVLRGLTTAALNGTRGTAVDFGCSERDPETGKRLTASGRYTVRLDGPERRLVKVRVGNVEEDEEGGGAS